MEAGQLVRVAGAPTPSPSPGWTYSVPIRIQWGIHQAMVDLGHNPSEPSLTQVFGGGILGGYKVCAWGYSLLPWGASGN